MSRLSVDNSSNAGPLNTECVSYTETFTNFGKIYTATVHPKHICFEDSAIPPVKKYNDPIARDITERCYRFFFIGDKSKNDVIKKHPPRIFTFTSSPDKKSYINNLCLPFNFGFYSELAGGTPSYLLTSKAQVTYSELTFFNYINYLNVLSINQNRMFNSREGCKFDRAVNNSKETPLILEYDKDKRLYVCEYLEQVSVAEHDNGDVFFSFKITGYAYNHRNKTLFKNVDDRYDLELRKDENAVILKNGNELHSTKSICFMFYRTITNSWIGSPFLEQEHTISDNKEKESVFLRLLEKYFFKHSLYDFKDNLLLKNLSINFITRNPFKKLKTRSNPAKQSLAYDFQSIYRVEKNKKLSNLPWNQIQLRNLYSVNFNRQAKDDYEKFYLARNNINRYLRKGDTKRATEYGYYGFKFPKAIKKLFLTIPPLTIPYNCTKLLFDIYKKYDVNTTLSIMKDDAGEIDIGNLERVYFLQAILLGFKKAHLVNDGFYTNDTMRMREALIAHDISVEFRTNNFVEYHNYISALYTAIIKSDSSCHTKAYKLIDTSMQLPSMAINGFTLRSPKNTYELVDVGTDMRHCVASYCRDYYYRNLEILLIEKDNKYVACIEIRDKFIVQAKLKFNAPIIDNKEVFNALKVWSEKHGYILDSTDCGIQKNKFSNVLEYQDSDDIYRATVISRLNYLGRVIANKFKVADKDVLKQTLSPGWLVVLDHHCALNTHGAGLRIWPSEKQPSEFEKTRDIWRTIFNN